LIRAFISAGSGVRIVIAECAAVGLLVTAAEEALGEVVVTGTHMQIIVINTAGIGHTGVEVGEGAAVAGTRFTVQRIHATDVAGSLIAGERTL
jgi:hypothetical protein